ncbi:MAG: Rrf2 family transcriptional regulator [Eggerthellaceae bacterium]|nr:Rrf2 family transcriptional regulator [Eggerthellaceae bacterium]
MLVTTKGRYAMRLMVYLALNAKENAVSLREVSEQEDISMKYLEQLARPLVLFGLLESVRGKGGGYRLAKMPDRIKAGDILRAAEGHTLPVACDGLRDECQKSTECVTVGFWKELDALIESYVDKKTLADIISEGV